MWGVFWSGKRDSNSRPRPWQGRALPTELFPQMLKKFVVLLAAPQKSKLFTRLAQKFRVGNAKVMLFFEPANFLTNFLMILFSRRICRCNDSKK